MIEGKVRTTAYISKELKELSKTNRINISETLEEALIIKFNIYKEENLLDRQKKAQAEIEFCNQRLKELDIEAKRKSDEELIERAKRFRGITYGT